MGSQNASTRRQAIVVAAFTVTCWPRMARRPISNPLNAPGTRVPGWALISGRKILSRAQMPVDDVGPGVQIEQVSHAAQQSGQNRA